MAGKWTEHLNSVFYQSDCRSRMQLANRKKGSMENCLFQHYRQLKHRSETAFMHLEGTYNLEDPAGTLDWTTACPHIWKKYACDGRKSNSFFFTFTHQCFCNSGNKTSGQLPWHNGVGKVPKCQSSFPFTSIAHSLNVELTHSSNYIWIEWGWHLVTSW